MNPSVFDHFPFLWGAATSSHQIEGNNQFNDWWAWEKSKRLPYASGSACDSFDRFEEDFDLITKLGHTAYRFSVEWSRVEPAENQWDMDALKRYGEMIQSLVKRNIVPVVTLHHFTNPMWIVRKGGWKSPETANYFIRYVRKVVQAIGKNVCFWITINEPLIYLSHSYYLGVWPPGHQSFRDSAVVLENMLAAHVRAYQEIHKIYDTEFRMPVWVSIAKHILYSEPCRPNDFRDRLAVNLRRWFFNDLFVNAATSGFLYFPGVFCKSLPYHHTLDFLGINYYSRHFVRYKGLKEGAIFGDVCEDRHHNDQIKEKNYLGWHISPEGFYESLIRMSKYGLPIMVTENGICTDDDRQRERFITSHIDAVNRARFKARVFGYLYWSLLDNFEWDKGFGPRFGIVDVNFETFERKIRKSAYVLSDVCRKLSHGQHPITGRFISDSPALGK